ncbi:DUF3022 domain-containing protein [Paraburkholderia fynbosensis]|uniref:DUF3022 domain-containing protein n=1 Tax=Paraburkholderia fynbosensis TaxID=1200993 RepID=A0A6J5GA31_9BURK|nr:DUF3022 domain-containing protein [Paraburkholderia fynbosensis]CAB3796105.1 hypothetical protein LMG27177_04032 [Paraburkholderia fynbosensis]
MNQIDLPQRIEEIELALSEVFESAKAAAVSSYDEGSVFFIHLSWVVESHRDASLDARCAITVRFSRQQIDRYAALDTSSRAVVRDRLCELVRARFSEQQDPPPLQGACSVELDVDDALLDIPDAPYEL